MRNNKIFVILALAATIFFAGCHKSDFTSSTTHVVSVPFIANLYASPSYVFGVGGGQIYRTIPDIIAVAVDTVYGFQGGFGGKTGKDSIYIRKTDLKGKWPDTTKSGGLTLNFEKFNLGDYKISQPLSVVLASPISNPGPTDISGTYLRAATGVTFQIKKVFNGVYVIDNPGGAGVDPYPYLLYNYKSTTNLDSLAFPTQTNPCGGGLKLVAPGAPLGLTSETYNTSFPPAITATSPLTLSWRVLEFPDTSPGTANPSAALCQWGTGARTFVKQ